MATEMDNKMNEFFQAIDEGRITHEEIIRRLENGIEAEYLKGKEANPKIIVVMEDMLYTMCTGNQPIPSNHPERYLAALREEMRKRRKPKANRLRWCFRVIAVTAAMFVFALAGDSIFHWQWFAATSTDDEQQYLIQGHEIDVALIQRSIAEHQGTTEYTTPDYNEVTELLGFNPGIPKSFLKKWVFARSYISFSPDMILLRAIYKNGEETLSFEASFFTNMENAFKTHEQNTDGTATILNDIPVYISENVDNIAICWFEDATIYRISGKIETEIAKQCVLEIQGGINDEKDH